MNIELRFVKIRPAAAADGGDRLPISGVGSVHLPTPQNG